MGSAVEVLRRRIVAVVNPVSGRRGVQATLRAIEDRLVANGASLEVRVTSRPGEATDLAARAADRADALLVVGGDGTLCEAVNGLIHRLVPVAVLGVGTENLMAKELRMPRSPDALADLLLHGETVPHDVGVVNDRRFLAVVGVGFDAECVERLTRVRRGHITHVDYAWPIFRAFFAHQFPRMCVDCDGERVFDGRGLVLIGVIPRYSIGLRLLARAKPDDGLLDVLVLPCATRTGLILHALRAALQMHVDHPSTVYRQAGRVIVTSPESVAVEIDGDMGGRLPIECHVLTRAATFIRPAPIT